ncbi:hypothetical protein SAMN04488134_11730 [Amphibacillus marinus]|uniref:Uncharacterized protein n=1 Tax=Amphibacillus marinus TaxID=872970 RepID=A0A1H8TLC4_9BACI|nr:NusG domain II-containing protein [Amphibacillus marinus]SEO91762.1 hypothetical protein SAMN04488134_11730 [Amphibacillus marinus]
MKAFLSVFKVGDLGIIIFLLCVSFFPFAVFYYNQSQVSGLDRVATISLDHELVYEINLTDHQGKEQFTIYTDDNETNTIEVVDGRIRIHQASCTDQVCVRTGYIDQAGQTIVCLPHQLVIEIKSNDLTDIDIISSFINQTEGGQVL